MSNSNKQPKTTTPTDADLKGNPGIGTSKGTTGETPDDMEANLADSTFEGDSESGTNPQGGIDKSDANRGPTDRP